MKKYLTIFFALVGALSYSLQACDYGSDEEICEAFGKTNLEDELSFFFEDEPIFSKEATGRSTVPVSKKPSNTGSKEDSMDTQEEKVISILEETPMDEHEEEEEKGNTFAPVIEKNQETDCTNKPSSAEVPVAERKFATTRRLFKNKNK